MPQQAWSDERERQVRQGAKRSTTSRLRVTVALAVGAAAALVTGLVGHPVLALLIGWDLAAITYVAWAWRVEWRLDAAATRTHAVRDDPGRTITDLLLLIASVASLGAVGAVIATAASRAAQLSGAGVGVASVAISWTLVHTVYTARYARQYYAAGTGVTFNEEAPPRYRDFAYLAFTIGMTYQVADTNLTTKSMRSMVLRHALLSYALGAIILAATINLIAGLAR